MRDSQHGGPNDRSGDGLTVLARTIVARLVAREDAGDRGADAAMVAALARALASPDPADFQAMRADLRRARIGEIDLVDTYFPAVARYLGCAWVEDRAPFTEVTLGVARMQSILRQVGRDWASNTAAGPDSCTVLMVLPEGEQHSFGAVVLTGQLRRQGVSVRLEIGTPPARLRALVQRHSFDCAMVSIGCEEKLEAGRRIVKALKDGSGGQLRVAVGGAALDRPVDVRLRTGADLVTNDPQLALQGLRPARRDLPVRAAG